MKLTSELLQRFGRFAPTSELDGTEGLLDIPSGLLPIITIPLPQRRFGAFSVTLPQRDSFLTGQTLGLDASAAAATQSICTFATGLWDILITMTYLANFTQASGAAASPAGSVSITDGTDAPILIGAHAVNGVSILQTLRLLMMIPENTWLIRLALAATGVAQTHNIQAMVLANRLH